MYRDQAESTQQRIDRLERELNVAYHEHDPKSDDAEIGLALLRFRAQRLAKDIDAFRSKHTKEPLLQRLGKRARAFGQSRFGRSLGFVCTFTLGLAVQASFQPKLYSQEEADARTAAQVEEDMRNFAAGTTTPAPTAADTSPPPAAPDNTPAPPDTGDEGHMHCPGSDAPPETTPRAALSMKDYKEQMALTQAFFRAVRKHDSAALAGIAHPHKDLILGDEDIQLSQAQLRDCFTSSRSHQVSKSAAADDTEPRTCGQIFEAYINVPYDRSTDVTFNAVPDLSGYSAPDAKAPFVFLYVPPLANEELSWQGVRLEFERYDGSFVVTGIHKAYWTP